MAIKTSYKLAQKEFESALKKAQAEASDLTIPLTLIAKDFFKSQGAIFSLKGPGQYPDIKESTKAEKLKKGFPVYPINKRTGRLAESLTNASSGDSINQIVNRKELVLGSRVPYARYIQDGTDKMPSRKILFIGPEAPRFATNEMKGRPGRWVNILKEYTLKKSELLGRVG